MTERTRTILFLICFALFVLTAPTIIFYSQGYRIDLNPPPGGKTITQTGGLFLKTEPKQVEIYLDGKLKKKTDFFFGSALIENLLPRKYKIEIKKEGYEPWEKNLEVKEKEVIEVKNIVLIPENPNFSILTEGIKEFWFSPDGKKIILKENPPAGGENGWALKLYDLERNVKSHLIDDKDVYPKGCDLLSLEFSKDSKEIYLNIGLQPTLHPPASGSPKEQEKNFVLGLDKVPPVLTERKITPQTEDIVTSQVFNGENYYLDNSGHLFKSSSKAKNGDERKFIDYPSAAKGEDEGEAFIDYGEKLTEKSFPVKAETEYKLNIFPDDTHPPPYIFLRENKTLYLFSPNSKSFEKFFENASFLKISPDLKKLLLLSDYEIWILFLKEIVSQPQRKAGEQLFLVRLSEKIGDCFWLNSDYLIFNAANKIKIAEIDDRDKINIVDIAEVDELPFISTHRPLSEEEARVFENPEIFWNQFDKKLYILSGENLSQSGKLLP